MIRFEDIQKVIELAVDIGTYATSGLWKKPLVSAAAANDAQFLKLKEWVSPEHLLPDDVLPGAKTVVCFFVPFSESVITSNADGEMASREWARAYIMTNELIRLLSETLDYFLEQEGFHTGKIPATHNFDTEKLISAWSHRHVAYIAGMGTFGLNNMLITENGCCGRFGSFVTDWDGEITQNRPTQNTENCLRKRDGTCGICLTKCPAGVYLSSRFDRHRCYKRCLENAELYSDIGLADVCGKCLCALPCSTKAPH